MKEESQFSSFLNSAVTRLSGVVNEAVQPKHNIRLGNTRAGDGSNHQKFSEDDSKLNDNGHARTDSGKTKSSKDDVPFGEGELKLENFEKDTARNNGNAVAGHETSMSSEDVDVDNETEATDRSPSVRNKDVNTQPHASNLPPLEHAATQGSAVTSASRKVSIASSAGDPGSLSGYAFASNKRNHDFHCIFKTLPPDDHLIDDYGCALQRDIFLHGRLYLSEQHICFNSSIFGWVTSIIIPVSEIVSVEKKSTAVVFPNAIQITTLHARYVFASFISRDTTFQLIITIWKNIHPFLNMAANGYNVSDASRKHLGHEYNRSDGGFSDSSEDEDGQYDDTDGGTEENTDPSEDDGNRSESSETSEQEPNISKLESGSEDNLEKKGINEISDDNFQSVTQVTSHAPTEWKGSPLSHILCSKETISLPLSLVFLLLWGSDTTWLMNYFKDEKLSDIKIGKWMKHENKWTRKVQYIKPVAPPYRQTTCYITDTIEHLDINDYIEVLSIASTPDVPSGSSFVTKTQYACYWGNNSKTKMDVSYTVEWNKSSWLKGPIEKGAQEGQMSYIKSLTNALESYKSSGKGKRRRKTGMKKKKKLSSEDAESKERLPSNKQSSIFASASSLIGSLANKVPNGLSLLSQPIYLLFILMFLLIMLQWWYMRQLVHPNNPTSPFRNNALEENSIDHIPMDDFTFKLWLSSRMDSIEQERDLSYDGDATDLENGKIKVATDYMERKLKKLKDRLEKMEIERNL
ncbi:GRAM domain-containing protein [Schizosaccharomyces cryophilus OY26]|uniref:GRAM domain-containing protein n=1 Tax=Schizosaccharomyces cryophilus (strain OY26 / ATCC MYA-4695 / CBS 11777 / NBRC 106824 / NRRL Y48691) TaxID=653667 RepID=S9VRW3_SCHCR|nr:GRAM domain-containing protein [Schizosaccharomyces cryophilus OY26]EPY50678.1 GRAM domain-containing protein [Schizosaccharomyces cryophilus OY26]